jgi:hypothetical protein
MRAAESQTRSTAAHFWYREQAVIFFAVAYGASFLFSLHAALFATIIATVLGCLQACLAALERFVLPSPMSLAILVSYHYCARATASLPPLTSAL